MSSPHSQRVEQALAWARQVLVRASDFEASDARVLLEHVVDVGHADLIAHPDRLLTPEQAAAYRALIDRRAAGVPVAYLTGARAFYARDFVVTPDVLIPRPETEHLVDAALEWAAEQPGPLRIVDVGTGSGVIAVTLAAQLPGARVWATDVSAAALAVTAQNAERHGVTGQITLIQGDLLASLIATHQVVDLIAANLPYIPSRDLETLAVVRFEPSLALDGGPDGLNLIQRLLGQVPAVLTAGGLLLLEIEASQGASVCALAQQALPTAKITILPDYAGHDRIVRIKSF